MKKTFFLVVSLFLAVCSSFADEQIKVVLNEGHPRDTIKRAYCNIFVTKGETDDDGNTPVSVLVENLDETNVILLFGHAYPEKALKRLFPSITFDKMFPGTKGRRAIDTYDESKHFLLIESSNKRILPDLLVKNGEVLQFRLPFYLAKYKNRKRTKILIMEKDVKSLDITVEIGPDEDYIRLNAECDTLVNDLGKIGFCTNPKHTPSLDRQEGPYKERIEELKASIDSIISSHGWYTTDKGYMRYDSLKQKLDRIDFTKYESDCGRHNVKSIHKCNYCRLSSQEIFHKLDYYYRRIYSSNDRKKAKADVMSVVNQLYKCHKNRKKGVPKDLRDKIEYTYGRICEF